MSFGSINNILILSTFKSELASLANDVILKEDLFPNTLSMIKDEFNGISDKNAFKIVSLLLTTFNDENKEKIDLVVTAPPSFRLRTDLTEDIVTKMLNYAKRSITITGYSVSDYIDEYIDLIVNKSQNGVFVKIYFNNLSKQDSINKVLRYQGKFLEIYDYYNEKDKMSALHAKVISVDGEKSLISSANLSYHGMSGNIEFGCLVESKRIASKIEDTLKQLVFQRIIKKYKGS